MTLPVNPESTREIRANFRALIDEAINHKHLIAIQRGADTTAGYIVPPEIGDLLVRLPDIDSPDGLRDWLHAINHIQIGGVHIVHPALLAHLESMKGKQRINAMSLAAMDVSLPATRNGKTVTMQFAHPGLVENGLLSLIEDKDGFQLQGSFDAVDPTRNLWIELPNGQVLDDLPVEGNSYRLPRTKINDEVDLLFAWLGYEQQVGLKEGKDSAPS